jgi:hypothetical protein
VAFPIPARFVEQPFCLDVGADGAMLALDRDGWRVSVARAGGRPAAFRPPQRSVAARFAGEHLLLLGEDDVLRTVAPDGTPVGETKLRAGATRFAVTASGGVLVAYGRRGAATHGVTLERIGAHPAVHRDPAILDVATLAIESGAAWILGTGAQAPGARASRLRPKPQGFAPLEVVALPAPPRAACVGPDGALYVVLEPGEAVVRVWNGTAGEPLRLSAPASDLARGERSLISCGPRGINDETALVPPPPERGPRFKLPACSP